MTVTQVWGALVIFVVCPVLGGLPIINWLTLALTGQQLSQQGTGNVSVSAAFYHGGRLAGVLAVASEALKGIAAVLLARYFFSPRPLWEFSSDPAWEMVALIMLVMGRYWMSRGAGTTNVVWGYVAHDAIAAGLVFLISSISFTILRERRQGKLAVLFLFPLMTALRHPREPELIIMTMALAFLLGWIYTKVPDDLAMDTQDGHSETRGVFQFFRGDRAVLTLDQTLDSRKVGAKAATLAHLKRLGYPVPMGWVLVPGDDPEPLLRLLEPSPKHPLIVRSSALGEDSETASAAGVYESIGGVTSREALLPAITRCLSSYHQSFASQYRRDRGMADTMMAVLIQQQIRGSFSGVAFSRDPVEQQGDAVVIEALPGNANQVVSGQVTPESYRVFINETTEESWPPASWVLPEELTLEVEGQGDVPPRLIQQVAFLARHLEAHYHGVPQDIEWTYDGHRLWLLQARPITTLLPIWTRKIAAEVIPGLIRPLTWSINRPLTCGVWGDLFTLVLGDRARGLDFTETATLHYSRAYFNASLLGQIFRRMGLPAESLEFLTRGAKFNRPPLSSTVRNLPGLLRLWQRERRLLRDFNRDYQHQFAPAIADLAQQQPANLSAPALLQRAERILALLKSATYYSILAPLGAALRAAIANISDEQIDNRMTPEVAALRDLQALAQSARHSFDPQTHPVLLTDATTVFATLSQTAAGAAIIDQFEKWLERYGYLSEVGTDIAVPTWREQPQPLRELFTQFYLEPPPATKPIAPPSHRHHKLQQRFDLKGQVTEVYSRLLAELRWSFIALEQHWLEAGWLQQTGDVFFLSFPEIQNLVAQPPTHWDKIVARIEQRRAVLQQDETLRPIPFLVYGNEPPLLSMRLQTPNAQTLRGIAASPGQAEGYIKVVRTLQTIPSIDRDTILVVPYTDSGWAPLLAKAGGLIAEVGGRLSHGAIVAREYNIPAVMDLAHATELLQDGQRVRIDGKQGIVEIL